ncbi:MAG: hypothetical protein ABJB97_12045 [Acidobacteriota bacterium]
MQSVVVTVTIALIMLSGCRRPSAIERQLIGTWESPGVKVAYSADGDYSAPDWVMQITFTADHKEFWRVPGRGDHAAARWHLEGDEVVFTMETEGFFGPPGTTRREKITKITSDELVFSDGSIEGRWRRVR